MSRLLTWLAFSWLAGTSFLSAQNVFKVAPEKSDMTSEIQKVINEVAELKGRPAVIELQNADYNLFRSSSSEKVYHISNTTSEQENPDQTKHIGLWLKGLKNVTIDGRGARLVMHGEMTNFVIDSCSNIKLRNLTITYADPTVPEMKVVQTGSDFFTAAVHPDSDYEIKDGRLYFKGESWSWDECIAQLYDPEQDITWRSWSPLSGLKHAGKTDDGLLKLEYDSRPDVRPGMVFQMRDSFRDETCGLIQYSRDIVLENIHFAFTGNFGIVGQMSRNLTYRNLTFEPEAGSGRTCSGFADFVQMSGCGGSIVIENSRFCGAHDDPINVHGTHLKVTEFISSKELKVRYMHPQTFGFQSFLPGDEIEFIDPHTLMPLGRFKVKDARMENERETVITLNLPVMKDVMAKEELVVENITYTPKVIIRNNYFSRVPTRGILVSTRKKVVIENNYFFRMQKSGILIADDARSWYESGMVRDVTIRDNKFIECGEPVIRINPENDINGGYVHRSIRIENNRFHIKGDCAVSARSVDGLKVSGNTFILPEHKENIIRTTDCANVEISNNSIQIKE